MRDLVDIFKALTVTSVCSSCNVVGFVDDDETKRGKFPSGVQVLGSLPELPFILSGHGIQEVIMAIPSARGNILRAVLGPCKKAGVRCRTLPRICDIIEGKISLSQIRDVEISDLLGRELVRIVELAEELIRLSGLVPYDDIDIVFTGLPPGEKLFEELLIDGEGIMRTSHEKIRVAAALEKDHEGVTAEIYHLLKMAYNHDVTGVMLSLGRLVPGFTPVNVFDKSRLSCKREKISAVGERKMTTELVFSKGTFPRIRLKIAEPADGPTLKDHRVSNVMTVPEPDC